MFISSFLKYLNVIFLYGSLIFAYFINLRLLSSLGLNKTHTIFKRILLNGIRTNFANIIENKQYLNIFRGTPYERKFNDTIYVIFVFIEIEYQRKRSKKAI